jgi:hypothetical protein
LDNALTADAAALQHRQQQSAAADDDIVNAHFGWHNPGRCPPAQCPPKVALSYFFYYRSSTNISFKISNFFVQKGPKNDEREMCLKHIAAAARVSSIPIFLFLSVKCKFF